VAHVVESGSQVGLPKVHETRKMGDKWDAKNTRKVIGCETKAKTGDSSKTRAKKVHKTGGIRKTLNPKKGQKNAKNQQHRNPERFDRKMERLPLSHDCQKRAFLTVKLFVYNDKLKNRSRELIRSLFVRQKNSKKISQKCDDRDGSYI
jgi:hypothetical protein